mmetsp:Transcript_26295/g.57017  ORF Transcript_26295/g.57017 Transcript_26295/m.57017 type:complete len:80 (+) Transcript_26295:57-296(+)
MMRWDYFILSGAETLTFGGNHSIPRSGMIDDASSNMESSAAKRCHFDAGSPNLHRRVTGIFGCRSKTATSLSSTARSGK